MGLLRVFLKFLHPLIHRLQNILRQMLFRVGINNLVFFFDMALQQIGIAGRLGQNIQLVNGFRVVPVLIERCFQIGKVQPPIRASEPAEAYALALRPTVGS